MSSETDIAIHFMVECSQKGDKGAEERFKKLIKSGAPKRFWNDGLEHESYKRYNTAHGIYKLDGEVLETIMSRKMCDISQFCEFDWFEWVMF